jgi:hypothetical protein
MDSPEPAITARIVLKLRNCIRIYSPTRGELDEIFEPQPEREPVGAFRSPLPTV